MLPLTLNGAAKAARKSKSAILEAIRTGRLSANRNDKNQWEIQPAELFRVYPQEPHETSIENRHQPQLEHTENHLKLLELLERERKLLLSQIDDLKEDRGRWRQQANALLNHQPTSAEPEGKPVSLLYQKLFGRK